MRTYNDDVLQPFGKFVEALGIPLAVIATPEAPHRGFEYIYRLVFPMFEKAGIPVYTPLDKFIDQYPNYNFNNQYFSASPIDDHPGPATSWFLGNYAADILEQNYASILGQKRTGAKTFPIEINDWLPLILDPQLTQETDSVARYTIEYPDQSSMSDFENHEHGNFLTLPLSKKHVKLNFKYPVKLSSITIEGEDLLSAEVYTLALNHKLGFDDQKPVRLGKKRGTQCEWADGSGRDVTSLLISAKTKDGKQAPLTVTIRGGEEAFD